MSLTTVPARDHFARHKAEWDALNALLGKNVLLDSDFVEPLLEQFGSADQRLAFFGDDGQRGMAILERVRPGFWSTFQPSQAPLGLILIHPETVIEQTLAIIREIPGIALAVHQQDPDLSAYSDALDHALFERLDYIETARITCSGTYEEYWASVHKNLRQNVERRERRFAREGSTIELLETRSPENMRECVKEYGALESAGWKARDGTAVTADNDQGRFYADALARLAAKGEAVVYRLQKDGRTIACDLCVERNGVIVILKTAYDEELRQHSPGLILHRQIIERVYEQGRIRTIEFYGRALDWHHKLSQEIRTMFHVNVYRNNFVRALRRLAK